MAVAGAWHSRSSGGGRLAVHRACDRHPGRVSLRTDRHGGLGECLRLERQRKPVRPERTLRRPPELPPSADNARARSEQLRHVDPQQRLLRAPGRSDPDCGCPLPGGSRQQAREGGRVLPNSVLFPVGHEFGRDHGPLPLPLFAGRRDQQAPVVLRRNRASVVLRPARPLPRHPRPVWRPAVDLAREPVLPRRELLGLAGRPEHRDVRLHHHGGVHDVGNVHADLPRGAPAHRRVGERGGGARRGERVEEVPSRHGADDPPGALHGRDAWSHRDLAGLRPDLRRNEGEPVEHDVDAGVSFVQRVLQQQRLGRRRRDRFHPLRDHCLLDGRNAAPHSEPGPHTSTAPFRPTQGVGNPDASRVVSAAPGEAP